jgi:hypothetical protein
MRDLHQRMTNLSPGQRALLEWRLMQRDTTHADPAMIPRRTTLALTPLSGVQQRLWFLVQPADERRLAFLRHGRPR